jgi:hypothetical protein
MNKSIMAQLPNQIIMDIIKIATHDANVDYWKSLQTLQNKPEYVADINIIGEGIQTGWGSGVGSFDENENLLLGWTGSWETLSQADASGGYIYPDTSNSIINWIKSNGYDNMWTEQNWYGDKS